MKLLGTSEDNYKIVELTEEEYQNMLSIYHNGTDWLRLIRRHKWNYSYLSAQADEKTHKTDSAKGSIGIVEYWMLKHTAVLNRLIAAALEEIEKEIEKWIVDDMEREK